MYREIFGVWYVIGRNFNTALTLKKLQDARVIDLCQRAKKEMHKVVILRQF